eukprot:CAMPEP_0198656660 /NCGR_PEP_ID=MMETSP1467-20131203/10488_1 /TAXON_ID=1462469 /ORGANISM="unid. sp., Strain CCMP2135" /LENGTH=288 /DNA_ID=CAMNT_0044392717 /DNA_START=53 /DNA_END=919 /DNA_ORIENTATION=+
MMFLSKVLVLAAGVEALTTTMTATHPGKVLSPFATTALERVRAHPIVQRNAFCEWFERGDASLEQARFLVTQFSVFSNLFLLAQLRKCLNAPTLEDMRESKEILANEIGVVFKGPKAEDIFSPEGSVEGGRYSHRAAHFEWLLDVGKALDLKFEHMGKRKHGSATTLAFCDALYDIYGSDDPNAALGASFAIEHWASCSGFWDQLERGFRLYNAKHVPKSPLGFWIFHRDLEAQHAAHTMDELEESLERGLISDPDAFLSAADAILDACATFWDGLEHDRKLITVEDA